MQGRLPILVFLQRAESYVHEFAEYFHRSISPCPDYEISSQAEKVISGIGVE